MVPEGLAPVHIRDMHLDDREFTGVQRIKDGNGCVRERSRIDDDAASPLPRFMDSVDDLMLGIALTKLDFEMEFLANAPAVCLHIRKGLMAVNGRLALS